MYLSTWYFMWYCISYFSITVMKTKAACGRKSLFHRFRAHDAEQEAGSWSSLRELMSLSLKQRLRAMGMAQPI